MTAVQWGINQEELAVKYLQDNISFTCHNSK